MHQMGKKAKKQANRERIHMKYSPLVERYLVSHKYETMNNVREWKMLLTQRKDATSHPSLDSSKKFERYRKIAESAVAEMKKISAEYDNNCKIIAEKNRVNEKAAAKHIATLNQSRKDKIESGGYSEYANMVVSIFNTMHGKDLEGGSGSQ